MTTQACFYDEMSSAEWGVISPPPFRKPDELLSALASGNSDAAQDILSPSSANTSMTVQTETENQSRPVPTPTAPLRRHSSHAVPLLVKSEPTTPSPLVSTATSTQTEVSQQQTESRACSRFSRHDGDRTPFPLLSVANHSVRHKLHDGERSCSPARHRRLRLPIVSEDSSVEENSEDDCSQTNLSSPRTLEFPTRSETAPSEQVSSILARLATGKKIAASKKNRGRSVSPSHRNSSTLRQRPGCGDLSTLAGRQACTRCIADRARERRMPESTVPMQD